MIKLRSMVQESEYNLFKKFKKYLKLKKWRWNKKLRKLLHITQMFTSTDNLSMITLNNFWLRKESWLLNMLILKELKEYLLHLEHKFFQLLITLKDQKKFWELVILLNKFWLVKIKSSSFQDAREMKHVLLCLEDQVNIFWTRLKDLFMMLCVCLFRLLRTNRLFMVEEILSCKWQLLVRTWPKLSKEKKL